MSEREPEETAEQKIARIAAIPWAELWERIGLFIEHVTTLEEENEFLRREIASREEFIVALQTDIAIADAPEKRRSLAEILFGGKK